MNEKKKTSILKNLEKYSAPALEKGLDIIEYLSEKPGGENLTSISNGIDKSKNEIFRMIAVLERRGYVVRNSDNEHYSLSPKLFHLGLNQPSKKYLLKFAFPLMEAFAKEVRHSCHLSIKIDNEITVIARVESPARYGISIRIGHRLPIHNTPSGHCITAFSKQDDIDRTIQKIKETEGSAVSKAFTKELNEIISSGFCIMENGFAVGVTGISAPIMDLQKNLCIAGLTTTLLNSVHFENLNINLITEKLILYAKEISLGYTNQ